MWISQENVNCGRSQSDQSSSPQRAQAPLSLRFPKSLRILKRSIFKDIARSKQRFVGSFLIIDYRPADRLRVGLVASRKFGSAVKRNRFKRCAREAFRQLAPTFPSLEIVILPNHECSVFSSDGMSHDLTQLANHYAQSSAEKSH